MNEPGSLAGYPVLTTNESRAALSRLIVALIVYARAIGAFRQALNMDLTEQQQRAIKEWAKKVRYVSEVRLFGSRAKGRSRPDSDADLALTLGGDDPGTILGNYFALNQTWQDELTSVLGLKAHVALYNDSDSRVRRYCDECSIVLFP